MKRILPREKCVALLLFSNLWSRTSYVLCFCELMSDELRDRIQSRNAFYTNEKEGKNSVLITFVFLIVLDFTTYHRLRQNRCRLLNSAMNNESR